MMHVLTHCTLLIMFCVSHVFGELIIKHDALAVLEHHAHCCHAAGMA